MSFENWTGRKVRCVTPRADIGMVKGKVYTIAMRVEWFYAMPRDIKSVQIGGRDAESKDIISVMLKAPKFMIAEMGPYLIDPERFVEVSSDAIDEFESCAKCGEPLTRADGCYSDKCDVIDEDDDE